MTTARLFGTDGMRGPFGHPPLDSTTVHALGVALGRLLTKELSSPEVLLGGDPRDSTPEICRWLATSLEATGCRVVYAGILPSPAVSRLVVDQRCAAGIAVSASHNPHPDNGIKLIDSDGSKWDPENESLLEAEMATLLSSGTLPSSESSPTLTPRADLRATYLAMLEKLGEDNAPFSDLRVTLDSSHGAASGLSSELFERLGATVHSLGDSPNGSNINQDCGSTKPQSMARATAETGSDVGFAFDGDADRVVLADEHGTVRDGDAILFLLATHMLGKGELIPPRIVATSMSNLGLEVALERAGIDLVRCDVGDRIVVRTLRQKHLVLGGEQSGHIIHLGLGATGDGMQTALLICKAMLASGRSLSELLAPFRSFPQVLHNVTVRSKPDLLSIPAIERVVRQVEQTLGTQGRLVLRYSGTEPLARVMIEGPRQDQVEALATEIGEAIEREIGVAR